MNDFKPGDLIKYNDGLNLGIILRVGKLAHTAENQRKLSHYGFTNCSELCEILWAGQSLSRIDYSWNLTKVH